MGGACGQSPSPLWDMAVPSRSQARLPPDPKPNKPTHSRGWTTAPGFERAAEIVHARRLGPTPDAIMGAMDHDALNKLIFALPQVGADLLRIVARDWVHLLDLESLERISAEHPSTSLTQRVGDLAWRVRLPRRRAGGRDAALAAGAH